MSKGTKYIWVQKILKLSAAHLIHLKEICNGVGITSNNSYTIFDTIGAVWQCWPHSNYSHIVQNDILKAKMDILSTMKNVILEIISSFAPLLKSKSK